MKYWRIALKDEQTNYYIEKPENVHGQDLMDGSEVGDGYVLTVVEMTEDEFGALPEFMGF